MKKSKKKAGEGNRLEIPAVVLARLQKTFQKPVRADLPCPSAEMVISGALGELDDSEQQVVENHLLTCRECLDLFLDVRLARDTADAATPEQHWETPPRVGRLKQFRQNIKEKLAALAWPRRLVPALAAVSLVMLVFLLGKEYRPKTPPPLPLVLESREVPVPPPAASALREPEAAPSLAAPVGPGLLAAKKKSAPPDSPQEKAAAPPDQRPQSWPVTLELTAIPEPGSAVRLAYQADRDVYAYLLGQDGSGEMSLLFSGRLEGGKPGQYLLPEFRGQSGAAALPLTVYLVASKNPLSDLPEKIKEFKNQQHPSLQRLFPDALIRSLTIPLP